MAGHSGARGGDPLPRCESWDKLPFFAAHQVDEVLSLNPAERTVHWLALDERGEYQPIERSGLIDLGPAQLDWP